MTEKKTSTGKAKVEPRLSITLAVSHKTLGHFISAIKAFEKTGEKHPGGPDELVIHTTDSAQVAVGTAFKGELKKFTIRIPTTFAPCAEHGRFRCLIPGGPLAFAVPNMPLEEWEELSGKLARMNAWMGATVPEEATPTTTLTETPAKILGSNLVAGRFHAARGFVHTPHTLNKRNPKTDALLFPEDRRSFYDMRTPLNWATGLALFSFTDKQRPGDWQEVDLKDLTDRIYCLTERDEYRHGNHGPDIQAELVKLFAETTAIVRQRIERHGHRYKKNLFIDFGRIIGEMGLKYLDTDTGNMVRPEDPGLPKDAIADLVIKGRREGYTPDGRGIKAFIGARWKLTTIRWRWSPSIVDDLECLPLLDKKGHPLKGGTGKPLHGGYYIQLAERIFGALQKLRAEKNFVAHDLLILVATDIYNIRKTSGHVIERNADRLFDLLGLDYDPKHKSRREEVVARAIFRLKQPDIGVLLAGSDETPRTTSNPERRKGLFYALKRSPLYTPPGILTKEQVEAIEAEQDEPSLPVPALPSGTPAPEPEPNLTRFHCGTAWRLLSPSGTPAPEPEPNLFDILGTDGPLPPPPPPIPTGAEIRAARTAAGLNLRRFADAMAGPSFKTWSLYETGTPIRVNAIPDNTWDRVRDFIAKHAKPVETTKIDGSREEPSNARPNFIAKHAKPVETTAGNP